MNRTQHVLLLLIFIALIAVSFVYGLGFIRQFFREPNWRIRTVPPDEVINFVLYTVDERVLNLTALLYELDPGADRTVRLEIEKEGEWQEIARTEVWEPEFIAPFQVRNWDDSQDYPYRIRHGETATYTGVIRANPVEKEELVVAAFACNGNSDRGPRRDLVRNIEALDPDLLFFSGDQVYDHQTHFESFHLFGRQFGEITRSRPTIVIPDDHDVGNANLWGAGGEVGFGGYRDPAYVNQVENAQTSHLPDPYDPAPIKRGIGTYYTSLTWGRVGFAILEDRKFKSQVDILDQEELESQGVEFSRRDHVTELPDPELLDVPGGTLLGERQLEFLRTWNQDWTDQDFKAVLSQAPFSGTAHLHGPSRVPLAADLDANGWPQSARDRALREIRKGFALMINGDRHLATLIQQGVEEHGDAGYSFSMPAIVSIYSRWWSPEEKVNTFNTGDLAYTGDFLDGFGNKITMLAYANPNPDRVSYNRWLAQGAGFGVIRFNKPERTITMELWPRGCRIERPACRQYPGWPVTISQEDNYSREAAAFLPTIQSNVEDPVIQVIQESTGEVLYTLRIHGTSYSPKVFEPGFYTLKIWSGEEIREFSGLASDPVQGSSILEVEFPGEQEDL